MTTATNKISTVYVKASYTYDQGVPRAMEAQGVKLDPRGVEIPLAALAAAGVRYVRGNPGCQGALRFIRD
jgi:hypothetical protein